MGKLATHRRQHINGPVSLRCVYCRAESIGKDPSMDFPHLPSLGHTVAPTAPPPPPYAPIGGATYTTYKSCAHTGSELVFEHDGRSFHGAKGMDLGVWDGWSVIIDLANNLGVGWDRPPEVIRPGSAARFADLAKFVGRSGNVGPAPLALKIDWKDAGAPDLAPAFWPALLDSLPEGRTVIACIGAHGRTGTALAALLIAARQMLPGEAIKFVREHHCDRAIESKAQVTYLYDVAYALKVADFWGNPIGTKYSDEAAGVVLEPDGTTWGSAMPAPSVAKRGKKKAAKAVTSEGDPTTFSLGQIAKLSKDEYESFLDGIYEP